VKHKKQFLVPNQNSTRSFLPLFFSGIHLSQITPAFALTGRRIGTGIKTIPQDAPVLIL
jgi:hypothetical protein